MKLNGRKIEGPNVEIIVIPRGGDTPDIILQARAVLDTAPFEKLCPAPIPPERILKGGKRESNFADPAYVQNLQTYGAKRIAWMVIESLQATEGLEWETVDPNDHTTWLNYEKELQSSGFSYVELQRIQTGVFNANCLNEARVEEARANFLRGPEEGTKESSGPSIGQNFTPSGKLVNDSK